MVESNGKSWFLLQKPLKRCSSAYLYARLDWLPPQHYPLVTGAALITSQRQPCSPQLGSLTRVSGWLISTSKGSHASGWLRLRIDRQLSRLKDVTEEEVEMVAKRNARIGGG